MPVAVRAEPLSRGPRFMLWRVLVWLLLFLAAFGCLQYFSHAELLWGQRHAFAPGSEAAQTLRRMLSWDALYFLAALTLIVLCAGCILRQAWARPVMRVAAAVLALYLLARGGAMLAQWPAFERASSEALGQLHGDAPLRQALQHARNTYLASLVIQLISIPALLWLSWRLGTPAVRMQFHSRKTAAGFRS